ncbi:hypothetical protein JCM10213_007484 [Rhodosporidiobolus nylandii]
MGFCRRCGEITSHDRCSKCGGHSRDSTTKQLFNKPSADKWSARYLSRTSSGGSSASSTSRSPGATSPVDARTVLPPPPQRPASPSKLHQSFLHQGEDGDGELRGVFGSVLCPSDHWSCAACKREFRQEETIYPHPDGKKEEKLAEVYFCRQCFAERFRKGNCKKCKFAVLGDAPFVKHDQNLWHEACYVCSYCPDPETSPIIDFAGRLSCESCFDAEAYKTHGIAPSPHLTQSEFLKQPVNVPPAPSKWGRPSISPLAAAAGGKVGKSSSSVWSSIRALGGGKEGLVGLGVQAAAPPREKEKEGREAEQKPKAWRLKLERDRSPIVSSLDELGEKLRKAGLEEAPQSQRAASPTKVPSSSLSIFISSPSASASTPTSRSPIRPALAARTTSASPTKPAPAYAAAFRSTSSSSAKRSPLPLPPTSSSAASALFPAPVAGGARRTHTPSKSIAERAALFSGGGGSGIGSSGEQKGYSHGRSKSVPVVALKPAPPASATATRTALAPIQPPAPSASLTRPLPSPVQPPSRSASPIKTSKYPSRTYSPVKAAEPPSRASSPAKAPLPSSAAAAVAAEDEDACAVCHRELGYGSFIELPKTGKVIHAECFVCEGCKGALGAGKHAEVEGRWWHKECAPPPERYRAILTSLRDSPPSSPTSPTSPAAPAPLTAPLSAAEPACEVCGLPLGYGASVTAPRSGKSFHRGCFTCGKCERPFGGEGARGFVEMGGLAYHEKCAPPPAAPSPSIRSSPFFAFDSALPTTSRTTRPVSLSSSPSFPPRQAPPSSPIAYSNPSIFARRPRPPAGLGGLLVCAGCGTRATERETVQGPRGRRFHGKCLVCGMCGRGLDSECRVTEEGKLRCEACRKTEARASYRTPSSTAIPAAAFTSTASPRRF